MLLLFPVTTVGGPTDVGVLLTTLAVPSLPASVLPARGSDDLRRTAADERAAWATSHRQYVEMELGQLAGLRQLHGMTSNTRPHR